MTEEFDGGWRTVGQTGTTQGSITADLHEAFTRAETEADWDKARAEHGDAATIDDLARTPGQRRADAWWAMCMAAIAHRPEGVNLDPVLNLVMDQTTFDTHGVVVNMGRKSRLFTGERSRGRHPGPGGVYLAVLRHAVA